MNASPTDFIIDTSAVLPFFFLISKRKYLSFLIKFAGKF